MPIIIAEKAPLCGVAGGSPVLIGFRQNHISELFSLVNALKKFNIIENFKKTNKKLLFMWRVAKTVGVVRRTVLCKVLYALWKFIY